MTEGNRRLAAIMFVDMVGYTALGQRDESLSIALVKEHRKLLRPICARHSGKEVKTMGDAVLIELPSALDAVRCAYDIQRASKEFNISLPNQKRIHLRVGIHIGDVVETHGDILGDAVNVASRIEALAEDGGVCLTQQVYDHVQNKFELPLLSLGKKSVKNVSMPVDIYRIVMPWEKKDMGPSSPLDKNRVAVLPFTNMTPDPVDEYFADGMTEELISTISKVRELSVISRTSVMQYKSKSKTIREIADELNVGTILEGGVRKAGNKVRITVQLIDAVTDEHLWAESYDRDLQDILAIQSDIARNVAESLKVQLLVSGRRHLQQRTPENTEAYTLYLKGRYFWNTGTMEGFEKALVQFEKAIEKDSTFAPSYSGLADTHLLMGRNGHVSPKIAYPKAIESAQKALALDEGLPEPHVTLAAIRQEYEWKWEESGRLFMQAIALNPSYATGHQWYALYLGHVGRLDEAIEEARRAQQLDPLSPRIHCGASEEYLFAHQYDNAIEAAEKALEINPSYGGAYGYRAYSYVQKGMHDEAMADFLQAGKLQGARAWMGRLGHAYAVSGRVPEAKKILKDLMSESEQAPPKSPFIPPPPNTAFDIGLVYLGLGDKEPAIDWLEKAADNRTAEIIHIKCEPIYEVVREEPRFRALVKRIGLDS